MKQLLFCALLAFEAVSGPVSAMDLARYGALEERIHKGEADAVRAEILPDAEAGEADAQFLMGFSYLIPEERAEMEKARTWLKRASDQGMVFATNAVGFTYYFGDKPDIDNAVLWYQKAIAAGDDAARLNLANVYAENPKRFPNECALRLPLYEAIKEPKIKTMADFRRALIIDQGCDGKLGDPTAAFPFVEPAAEAGDPYAQFWMAIAFNSGRGAPKDEERGWAWTLRSAESGHPEAQWYVGIAALQGTSQPKDSAAAFEWFRKAAAGGSQRGMTSLAVMYATGDGTTLDYRQALVWYRKAAEEGYHHAQKGLGVMYMMGQGVAPDTVEAKKWFNLSREQGNPEVAQFDDLLTPRLSEDQIAEAKRRSEAWKAQKEGHGL